MKKLIIDLANRNCEEREGGANKVTVAEGKRQPSWTRVNRREEWR